MCLCQALTDVPRVGFDLHIQSTLGSFRVPTKGTFLFCNQIFVEMKGRLKSFSHENDIYVEITNDASGKFKWCWTEAWYQT